MKLHLADQFILPLAFLEHRKVVLGGSGTGKTAGGRVVFEEATKAGVICGAIDLKGDWWGLKSSADGKAEGIPVVIFGGDHQDVPLDEAGGAATADIVVDLRQPFILDLENFSKGKQLRFIAAFAERLYDRNRKPLVMFWDEIDRYAPQKPMSPEANVCLGAMEDIAKRGRKHGIFSTFITQRNAGLNKGVSELCDVAMVFRTPGPRDQEAVKDWFDTNATKDQRDAVMADLAGLPTGTAILCCAHPTLRLFQTIPIRLPETFDSSATPEIGGRLIVPKKLAAPDLKQLQERMAATIEKAKADDPKELRAKIHQLETENRKLKAVPEPKVEAPKIEKRSIITEAQIKRLEVFYEKFSTAGRIIMKEGQEMSMRLLTLHDLPALAPTTQKLTPTKLVKPPDVASPGTLPVGETKILTAIAQYPDGVTREQLSVLTGYRRSSRDTYIQKLSARGFTRTDGGQIFVTDTGMAVLGQHFRPLPIGEALRAHWLRELPAGERIILEILINSYPETVERTALDDITGYKRSSRDTYLQKLIARQLVWPEGRGSVKASGVLFE